MNKLIGPDSFVHLLHYMLVFCRLNNLGGLYGAQPFFGRNNMVG